MGDNTNPINAAGAPAPYDPYCGRTPDEIPDLVYIAKENEYDNVNDFVLVEEGTYNPLNGHFTCDECYVRLGMPTTPTGWKCP